MLKVKSLNLQRGNKVLLENAQLYVNSGNKVGIIGNNGSGKSSFFSLLLGELDADQGSIELHKGMALAHLEQEITANSKAAVEYVMDGDGELRAIEAEISQAEKENNPLRLSDLSEKMLAIDGYNAKNKAAALLYGLGFKSQQIMQPVADFSGGWRMRLNLAKTLMARADFFLLDEPTNHLDLEAIVWLESWLAKLSATVLVISHDRAFLDNVVTHIAHFEHQKIVYYTGNYTSFEKQRAQKLLLQQATHEKQQKKRAHLQSFVDRFRYKASKAKQAQSRIKALEKMEQTSAAHLDSPFSFHFKTTEKLPKPCIRLDKVAVGYADKVILKNINLTINPGDRYGIIGPNGAGKSTFIKLLAKQNEPQKGEVFYHNDLNIGYFTQHQLDYLDLAASPMLHIQRLSEHISEQEARNYFGQYNFHGDRVFEGIAHFSGGEKARLALALLIWQKPNLLLLDEPTNHFDLDMRYALNMALQSFKGAIVLISHDRYLINSTCDDLLLVHEGKVALFKDSLADYPNCLANITNAASKTQIPVKKSQSDKRQKAKEIRSIELKLSKLTKELESIESKLHEPTLYQENNDALNKFLEEQKQLKEQIQVLEDTWMNLHDE